MSSIRIATPLVLAIGLALSACQQPAGETGEMEGTPSDTVAAVSAEEQLETLRDDYEAAWEAHDVDAMLAMMSPDYQEIGPMGAYGYAEAEAMMRDTANMAPEGSTISIDMETIEVAESGDVAYASGESSVTIPAAEGREESTETMEWVAGFKKVDGVWKIDRLAMAAIVEGSAPAGNTMGGEETTGEM